MKPISFQLTRLAPMAGWIAAAFLAGALSSGGRPVHAQAADDFPMVEVRGIGSESHLIVHYPRAGRMYVFNNAFTGAPKRACSYYFKIGNPGEAIRRELCPSDLSDR